MGDVASFYSAAMSYPPKRGAGRRLGRRPEMDIRGAFLYSALFLICLLAVMRVITWPVMLLAVTAALFVIDRKMLIKADFMLLLTFAAFFIFPEISRG
jgi:hypothetical protein